MATSQIVKKTIRLSAVARHVAAVVTMKKYRLGFGRASQAVGAGSAWSRSLLDKF
jgi:hypothetical protein